MRDGRLEPRPTGTRAAHRPQGRPSPAPSVTARSSCSATQGLGAVLGSVGNFIGGLDLGGAADQARQATGNVQPGDLARAAEQARNGAWGTLVGSLLGLGASALGGFLGAQRDLGLTRLTGVRQRRIID